VLIMSSFVRSACAVVAPAGRGPGRRRCADLSTGVMSLALVLQNGGAKPARRVRANFDRARQDTPRCPFPNCDLVNLIPAGKKARAVIQIWVERFDTYTKAADVAMIGVACALPLVPLNHAGFLALSRLRSTYAGLPRLRAESRGCDPESILQV
jgi:hypothetical protein